MTKPITEETIRYYYCLLACLFMLVGLLFSKLMLSMGMIGLAVNAVFHRQVAGHWRTFVHNPALLGLTAVFAIYLVSGLWSENTDWLFNRLRMKLPFLWLPFAVVAIPRFNRKVYLGLLYFFLLLILGECLYLTGWYIGHFAEMTDAYKRGQVLPTPVQHIRFSLLAAYAVGIAATLCAEGYHWKYPRLERAIQLAAGLFLFAFLHLLAVRSGLVALYLLVAFGVGYWVWQRRNYGLGLLLAVGLLGGAGLAYRFVPTLQNKINYTLYNLHLIREGKDLANLSDSYRVATIEAGLALGAAHPWTGVGIGDIKDATEQYLQMHYPSLAGSGFMPQSQYVLVFAATGLVGLLVFGWATLYPAFYQRGWRDPLLLGFLLIACSSFAIEQTLETQVGTAFYLVFVVLALRAGPPQGRQ